MDERAVKGRTVKCPTIKASAETSSKTQYRLLLLDYPSSLNKKTTASPAFILDGRFVSALSYCRPVIFFAQTQKFHKIDLKEACLFPEVLATDSRELTPVYER